MDMKHQSWLGRTINVTDSSDVSLIGLKGLVLDETRETIIISHDEQTKRLGKQAIRFTVDDSKVINGSLVRQRAEDRINRNYKEDAE
ncbi:MAG TPA: hypothetical protein D7H86_01535 [Candidatus Poseidoniales archaeon]|jgi:RNase P/RNase MRP subunit p29|nr:hypothetical protein [Euryarchaeota archaeon]DAC15249.1 MAG TPA: hypothetical protein D7H86_01535 [Candidatus Poseidoniales archaeon]|tara:strand:- start:220 stop:480 length:261 start_codon:yes stop_codon:yes gene_type:complete